MYVTQQIMLHRSFQTGHNIGKEFSLAKKDEKKRFQRNETKKGTRVKNFQKEKKNKITM